MFLNIFRMLLLIFFSILTKSAFIYDTPSMFYTQLCTLGSVSSSGPQSFSCTTTKSQDNIIRIGLSAVQYSKPVNEKIKFTVSASYSSLPTTNFALNVDVNNPDPQMYLGFFLLIIKSQPTDKYIDLIQFGWGSGSNVDVDSNLAQFQTAVFSIPSTTIFSTVPASLEVTAFMSYWSVSPKTSTDTTFVMQFSLSTSIALNTLTVRLDCWPKVHMNQLHGFVILINTNAISLASSAGVAIAHANNDFNMGQSYTIYLHGSSYGPKYAQKCFIGIYYMKYKFQDDIDFVFWGGASGTYQSYHQTKATSATNLNFLFCFGHGLICAFSTKYMDKIDGNCYTGATCPLPVPAGWQLPTQCPSCTQLACLTCSVADRSNCLTCKTGINVHFDGTSTCVCDANHIQVTMPISTSALGQWNNVANSLVQCKLDCSISIPNCKKPNCTSTTFCNQCQASFLLNFIDATHQNCLACSYFINNCTACTDSITCTQCEPEFYLQSQTLVNSSTRVKCSLCSSGILIPNCITCSDQNTCLTCTVGYQVDSTSKKCICDPAANSLMNCGSCTLTTACDSCVSNSFYLSSSTSLCQSCSVIHAECLQCSSQTFCSTCDTGYLLKFIDATHQSCGVCPDFIPNCLNCIDIITCSLCSGQYYLESQTLANSSTRVKCSLCSSSASIPNCVTCSDQDTCVTCVVGYQLHPTAKKCICDPVANSLMNCVSCTLTTACDSCISTSYYLSSSASLCESCSDIHAKCLQCSTQTYCTNCDAGYFFNLIDATHQSCGTCPDLIPNCLTCIDMITCSLCSGQYYLKSQTLANSSTKIKCQHCGVPIPNCVACSDNLTCTNCLVGFDVDSTTKKCVCNPTTNSLANCKQCLITTECDVCNAAFYVSSSTHLCQPCSNIHPSCSLCSSSTQCTQCNSFLYVLDGIINAPGATCSLCNIYIDDCTECTSMTVCTNCDLFFGVNSLNSKCQLCDPLVMPGCLECEIDSVCLTCNSTTHMISGVCHFCSEISMCQTCFVNTSVQLECLTCVPGYILKNIASGQKLCMSCQNIINYCSLCDLNGCLSCISPYLLGPTGLCDHCQDGYDLKAGFCMKFPGCQTSVKLSNGSEICIACVQELHFVLDQRLMKCVCDEGFTEVKEKNNKTNSSSCLPVCGDGIILKTFQQCDDKNTENNDGCDSSCSVQQDYFCSQQKPGGPSKCVLNINIAYFVFNYATRTIKQNKGILSFSISPRHQGLAKMNWSELINLNFSQSTVNKKLLKFQYRYSTGQLLAQVPYYQDIQDSILQSNLNLDPQYIKSTPNFFKLINNVRGVNSALVVDSQSLLAVYEAVDTFSIVLVYLILAQFYLSSFVHKMIGLETIQIIQLIYFARVATSSKSMLLSSINSVSFAASGYQNAELIYGKSELSKIQSDEYNSVAPEFSSINLRKYFLLNTNFSLVLLILSAIVFGYTLVKKFKQRSSCIQSGSQLQKDNYTKIRRSSQWVYDHFFFPYALMLNLLGFFNLIIYLQGSETLSILETNSVQEMSFAFQVGLLFLITLIFCFELFCSYEDYTKYKMTSQERNRIPKSTIEKLQHDENNPDRANYHPVYILIYMLYYMAMEISIVIGVFFPTFQFSLELCLGISLIYFVLILKWNPYHNSINIHNQFLKLNQGATVAFLIICQIFTQYQLEDKVCIALMALILVLITIVMVGGFVRILLQRNFRKKLELSNASLFNCSSAEQQQSENTGKLKQSSQQKEQPPSKKAILIQKNQYVFQNQLVKMQKDGENNSLITDQKKKNLSQAEKQHLIYKIRKDYAIKKQNIILEDYLDKNMQYNKKNPPLEQNISKKANPRLEKIIKSNNNQANTLQIVDVDIPLISQYSPTTKKNKAPVTTKTRWAEREQLLSQYQKDENDQLKTLKRKMRLKWENMQQY